VTFHVMEREGLGYVGDAWRKGSVAQGQGDGLNWSHAVRTFEPAQWLNAEC
jgi:hypothetical protein